MEQRQSLITLYLIVISILFLSCWYGHESNLYKQISSTDRTYLSHQEAKEVINNYDPKKTYFYEITTKVERSRSNIPFVYNKQLIYKSNKNYYSNN